MSQGIDKLEREIEAIEDKLRKVVDNIAELGERRSRHAVDRLAEIGERGSRQAIDRLVGRRTPVRPRPHPVLITSVVLGAGLLGAVLWSLSKDLGPPTQQDDRPGQP